MNIKINITKTKLFIILGAVFLIGGLIFGYAYPGPPGIIPNPGHALDSIQGYFQNDGNLQVSLGKLCQSDGEHCKPFSGVSSVQLAYANMTFADITGATNGWNGTTRIISGSGDAFTNISKKSGYAGIRCDSAQGWKLISCWDVGVTSSNELKILYNATGCTTSSKESILIISCMKVS